MKACGHTAPAGPPTQRGWVLPSVMALVLLVSLAAWAQARQLWLQEQVLKLQAQRGHNRALAQASVQVALQDILGSASVNDLRHQMGEASDNHVFFPRTLDEREVLRQRLAGAPCREGICITNPTQTLTPTPLPSFSLDEWVARTAQARAVAPTLLPDDRAQAWYGVEIWVDAQDLLSAQTDPAFEPRFYYRITAWVLGGLPGSRAALQAVWRRDASSNASSNANTTTNTAGHWLSWQWLTP